jgi:hypothetical protein
MFKEEHVQSLADCYGPAHGRQLTGTPDRNP